MQTATPVLDFFIILAPIVLIWLAIYKVNPGGVRSRAIPRGTAPTPVEPLISVRIDPAKLDECRAAIRTVMALDEARPVMIQAQGGQR